MDRRGFTIVELIIVITVMGILLTLSVVNLRSTQLRARDTERKTDLENIATHLETYYRAGNDVANDTNRYPSTGFAANEAAIRAALRDIDVLNLRTPGAAAPTISLKAASSTAAATPTINEYIYQPIKTDGTLCTLTTDECRRFILTTRLETDDTIYQIESKNQ